MSFNLLWWLFPVFLIFSKRNDKYLSFFLLLFLVFVMGMRSFVGVANDTENYYTLFMYGKDYLQEYYSSEPLNVLINTFIISLGASFQWVLMIFAIISVSSVFIACKIANVNKFKGLMLYVLLTYYFYTFNCMRQMTADAILLIGYAILTIEYYSKSKKILLYCLIVLLASSIHNSAMIAFVIVPIYYMNYKISFCNFTIIAIITLIAGVLPFAKGMVDTLSSMIGTYSVDNEYGVINSVSSSKIAMTLFYIYMYKISDKNDILIIILAIGLFLFNFMGFNVVTMRAAYTFLICQILYLSKINLLPKYYKQQNIVNKLVVFYCIFLYYYFYYNNISDIQNYEMNSVSNLIL